MARTVTTLTRLLDICSLFDDDHRVQVAFTFAERERAVFAAGLEQFLSSLEAVVLPWEQAVRTRFDLAVAASENDALDRLDCPVLLVPHGIGHQKYYPGSTTVSGLNPDRLRGEHVRVGLSHANQLGRLEPEVAARAVVIGDPCHDRMLVSAHRVPRFRRALGAGARRHVVLASTWGPQSLLGANPLLPQRFLSELPLDDYQVSLVLHPGVWSAHSPHQVRANLATAIRGGLTVIPPQHGWQAAILAAELVVADCGSMPLYATAAQVPVLLGSPVADTVVPGSPLANLVAAAPRLDDSPLPAQLDHAIAGGPVADVAGQAVEYAGKCAEILRPLLYELLDLDAPAWPAVFPPIADPVPERQPVAAFRVGVTPDGRTVARFPAAVPGRPLPGQHVVAHGELATLSELEGADVVYREAAGDFASWATETAHHRPHARLIAEIAPDVCRVWTDGQVVELPTEPGADPLIAVSRAHWRTVRRLPLTDQLPNHSL
ncbi:hypothetical protein [Amycolatopsis jiangsuensis]|uniref:Uncharacterized protein n=1 Tax=Amycolatopsis jiangsuensis TaxID=1181879 RepID=A0A840IWC2_9PSEU|nr:hypothetical protein [Amycolatopsis jiangsuensis]MBB4687061.1 hypothetical protein [Amycolatopsis jiangsuensis]